MSNNQMIPFEQSNSHLQRGGYSYGGQQLLHNTGSVYVDRETASNLAIYNAPGGTINIITQSSSSGSSSSGWYHCNQHNMVFYSWQEHINSFSHRYCPVPGCAVGGVDFGYDSWFCQHWQDKHCG